MKERGGGGGGGGDTIEGKSILTEKYELISHSRLEDLTLASERRRAHHRRFLVCFAGTCWQVDAPTI